MVSPATPTIEKGVKKSMGLRQSHGNKSNDITEISEDKSNGGRKNRAMTIVGDFRTGNSSKSPMRKISASKLMSDER